MSDGAKIVTLLSMSVLVASCARGGFGASLPLDGAERHDLSDVTAADATSVAVVETLIPSFATSSTSWVDVTGGRLTFVPSSREEAWLVLLSAALSTSSVRVNAFTVEARYLIDGVERGVGGVSTSSAGQASTGPFAHFALVRGATTPRTVVVQLRERDGGRAVISNLRILAVPLPASADPLLSETDGERLLPETDLVEILDLPVGSYMLLSVVSAEDYTDGDVYTWVEDGAGQRIPASRCFSNGRHAWQPFMLTRQVEVVGAPQRFTMHASQLAGDTANIAYSRMLAFRADAFREAQQRLAPSALATTSDETMVALALEPAGPDAAYLSFQNLCVGATEHGPLLRRAVTLQLNGASLQQIDYAIEHDTRLSVTAFAHISGLERVELENRFGSPDGAEIWAEEGAIQLLRLR